MNIQHVDFVDPPFPRGMQLNHEPVSENDKIDPRFAQSPSNLSLPGEASITLSSDTVTEFLINELDTPALDELYPKLHFVTKKSGDHIDPLHIQKIKRREIYITENPKLHLVWIDQFIFIKPIPTCLLNYEFWKLYICHDSRSCPSNQLFTPYTNYRQPCILTLCLGFLRSYALLIQHESDFRIALEASLLPKADSITWASFSRFISPFRKLEDRNVAPRYHFGQIRLTWLNWAVRLLQPYSDSGNRHSGLGRRWVWHYQSMYWETSPYIERYFVSLLFVFASLTAVLSALQLILTVPESDMVFQINMQAVATLSVIFGVVSIFFVLTLWVALFGGILVIFCSQLLFAIRHS